MDTILVTVWKLLAFGQSISQSQTVHEMAPLHTGDVPSSWLQMLKLVGWQLVSWTICSATPLFTK